MWHVTHDMWHVTLDMWRVTCDKWQVWGGEHSLKISVPQLLLLVIYDIMKIRRKRLTDWLNEWMNQSMTKLFIEQPQLHRVC